MTYATIFSGIGGWEEGLNECGWTLKWQCEIDPYCKRKLRESYGVPVYGDITSLIRQPGLKSVDVLVGSPPCQPFSTIGKRAGKSDPRHLYPAFIECVDFLKPRWVLMEQVPAILTDDGGRSFGQYIGGLASIGFSLCWHSIPACTVGAPHERDRVWIIANSTGFTGFHESKLGATMERLSDKRATWWESNPWPETESKICTVDDGIIDRCIETERYGLAVIPQIPRIIGEAINEIESSLIS